MTKEQEDALLDDPEPSLGHAPQTPLTDAMVTGNSNPSVEEYEDLAAFARNLECELKRAKSALACRAKVTLHREDDWREISRLRAVLKRSTAQREILAGVLALVLLAVVCLALWHRPVIGRETVRQGITLEE